VATRWHPSGEVVHRGDDAPCLGGVVDVGKRLVGNRNVEKCAQWFPALRHFELEQPLGRTRGPDVVSVLVEHADGVVSVGEAPVERCITSCM